MNKKIEYLLIVGLVIYFIYSFVVPLFKFIGEPKNPMMELFFLIQYALLIIFSILIIKLIKLKNNNFLIKLVLIIVAGKISWGIALMVAVFKYGLAG